MSEGKITVSSSQSSIEGAVPKAAHDEPSFSTASHPSGPKDELSASAAQPPGPERSRLSQTSQSLYKELSESHFHPQPTSRASAAISGTPGLPPLAPPPSGTNRSNSDQTIRIPSGIRGGSFTQQHSEIQQQMFRKKSNPIHKHGKVYVKRVSRRVEDVVSSDEEGGNEGDKGQVSEMTTREPGGEEGRMVGTSEARLQWSADSYEVESVQQPGQRSGSKLGQPLGEGVEDGQGRGDHSRPVELSDPPQGSHQGARLHTSLPAHVVAEIEAQTSEGVLFNDALRRGTGTDSDNVSPKGSFVGRKGSFATRLTSWFSSSNLKGGGDPNSPRRSGSILGRSQAP